ncbi:MAG: hypothetical protein LQ346_002520 [Caloplaca aetnensis]|nr:MAG: hypothetical protein LQ346_002520 [Caloplaca aetnensis]
MASVPLHCHICPKKPTFSDISHLLTHVGSKGHLSHYFKAQVRAPQNPAIRQQLDTYEQWFKDYHIEKLLSQRMILKDSKKANGVSRAAKKERSASTKPSKTPKASSEEHNQTKSLQATAADSVIDPQLSKLSPVPTQQAATQEPSPTFSSPGLDLTSVYRAPMPRMRTFHPYAPTAGPSHDMFCSTMARAATGGERDGSDTESEDNVFGRQDSTGTMYPEPPSAEILPAFLPRDFDGLPSPPAPRRRPRLGQRAKEEDPGLEEDFMPRTPELKGIYYPGMSLFDSASPDAQRKRNQRKDESLIAQIEQESLEVECNEYIYWPDGALKMCRFITGDVQSSPPKEDTPPPPMPPKVRRGRKPKGGDANTIKRKPRKAKGPHIPDEERPKPVRPDPILSAAADWAKYSPALRNTTPKGLGHPRNHGQTVDEDDGWLLNTGEPIRPRRTMTPVSLNEEYSLPDQLGDPPPYTLQPVFRKGYPKFMEKLTENASEKDGQADVFTEPALDHLVLNPGKQNRPPFAKDNSFAAPPQWQCAGSDKENVPFVGHDAWKGPSHRYFTVKGNHEPQVTATLPKEMAFAGMATPPVYRMSLNPLNPNAHLRQSLPYSGNYTSFRTPMLQTNHVKGTDVLGRRSVAVDEVTEDSVRDMFTY